MLNTLPTNPDELPPYDDPNHLSSLNENNNDDDIALGDEAGGDLLSDEDGHISRSINVSPHIDDDSDLPELLTRKSLETPPSTPSNKRTSFIDQTIGLTHDYNIPSNTMDDTAVRYERPGNSISMVYNMVSFFIYRLVFFNYLLNR